MTECPATSRNNQDHGEGIRKPPHYLYVDSPDILSGKERGCKVNM